VASVAGLLQKDGKGERGKCAISGKEKLKA